MKISLTFILLIIIPCLAFSRNNAGSKFAPVADFTSSKTKVLEGDSISFYDISTNQPDQWEWSFEGADPAVSAVKNPVVRFLVHGAYTVKLRVSNPYGSDSVVKIMYVHVFKKLYGHMINYPLKGDLKVYPDSNGGYKTGNNSKKVIALANSFVTNDIYNYLERVYYKFGVVKSRFPDHYVRFAVWEADGDFGPPSKLVDMDSLKFTTILDSFNENRFSRINTYHWLWWPWPKMFYIGLFLPQSPGDTLALVSNSDKDTIPGTAWEMWSDSTWHPFYDSNSWDIDISLAIFADMYRVINDITEVGSIRGKIYPNPASGYFEIKTPYNRKMELCLFNNLGERIFSWQGVPENGKKRFDVSELPPGIYFIQVLSGNVKTSHKLIIEH